MTRHRVFHRLPTAALLSEGIAPVDSPWKTLLGKTKAARPGQRSPRATPRARHRRQTSTNPSPPTRPARIGSLSHWNMLCPARKTHSTGEWVRTGPIYWAFKTLWAEGAP